jgi:glutaminyl-peptide cyclotransferase
MKSKEAIRISRRALALLLVGALAIAGSFLLWRSSTAPAPAQFTGDLAYQHVIAQMNFGPRVTGTAANVAAGDYILAQLAQFKWQAEAQTFTYQNTRVRNILGRANVGKGSVIIIGAHYDSRRRTDQDKIRPDEPVPGANDGASGVAVLLELARVLDLKKTPSEIWLAFFDAEDNGNLGDGWDWIVGSTYMAEHLPLVPQAMLLVDMVGDADQQFYFDQNSDASLSARIWAVAAEQGYSQYFIPQPRWAMLDDHTPFAQRGIPAVDIIDFAYGSANSYWHTTADTADKVSAASLERVGRTLVAFLQSANK